MPKLLTGSKTNATPAVNLPLGGEPRTVASLEGAFQALTDRSETLEARRYRRQLLNVGSGTWTKPEGLFTRLRIRCVAGGPGGGTAVAGTTGGGGASGEDRTIEIDWASVPATVAWVVGAGGTVGAVGGNTNFGTLLTVESLGFGGNGVATQLYGGGGGGKANGGNGVAGGGPGGGPSNTYEQAYPRASDAAAAQNGGFSHYSGWGGGGKGGSGGNHGGAGAPGPRSNGGGGGGAGGGSFKGGSGAGVGGGFGDGYTGAGYGGGGGGLNNPSSSGGGGGGGGGATDIEGAPATTQSTTGKNGVIVLEFF